MTSTHSHDEDRGALTALAALFPDHELIRTLVRPQRGDLVFRMLPRRSRTTFMLPGWPPRVSAAAIVGRMGSRRFGRAAAVVARVGAARLVPGSVRLRPPPGADSLVDHLGSVLGAPLYCAIHLGPPRANRKPVLHLMGEDGRTIAYVKVGFSALTRARVTTETQALRRLGQAEIPGLVAPRVLHAGAWRECDYLVLSAVPTRSVSGGGSQARQTAVRGLATAFGELRAPLKDLVWWRDLGVYLQGLGDSDTALALRRLAVRLEEVAGAREVTVGSSHGDWSPWNMAAGQRNCVVWDWERFTDAAPIGYDELHHAVQAGVRLDGLTPTASVRRASERSEELVTANGGLSGSGPLVLALYLIQLGERFERDQQEQAGARKGPLADWLLPELECLVDRLHGAIT